MIKFLITLAGALLLFALGVALSVGNAGSSLVHGAVALTAVDGSATDHRAGVAARHDAARRVKAAPGRAPLLLSPFGAMPPPDPESLPADPSVRTRSGLYATPSQANALAGELRGDVVWVDVGCCAESAIDMARGHVAGMMAADDLADDAPVFVSGADLATAALLVDRLAEQRLTRVFLVPR